MLKQIIFIGLLILVCHSTIEVKDDVLILDDDTFDIALKEHKFLLVKFYAQWCGHCKKLAPEFVKAAQQLKAEGKDIVLGEVDTGKATKIARRYGVTGIPQVKLFLEHDQNVAADYEEKRKAENIVKWCYKKSNPPSELLEKQEDLDKLIADNKLLIVYFGKQDENFQVFQKYAISLNEVSAYHIFDDSLMKQNNIKGRDTVVLFKSFDEKRNDYVLSKFTFDGIRQFIEDNYLPMLMELDQDTVGKTLGDNKPILVLFHKVGDTSLHGELDKIASILKGKIFLFTSQIEEGIGAKLAEHGKISENMLPMVRIITLRGSDLDQYQLETEITGENIVKFQEQWSNGKIKKIDAEEIFKKYQPEGAEGTEKKKEDL